MLELLSPAGSYEAFEAALAAGADAVYAGGTQFGARAYAANFSKEEILQAIDKCCLYGKKLYLTVNTLCKDREFAGLYDFLEPFYRAGLHGVIVQDIGVIRYIRAQFPELSVHASTQMTISSPEGARFLKSIGVKRVVPSRELNLQEIKKIHDTAGIEIESFVHGAMCYCYSGQCLFSGMLGGRSGNRGRCAQPCRLPYEVWIDDRLQNGREENYPLSMKDLCGLSLIPDMAEAGVVSFKIEGRMKKPAYTAGVTSIYRKYIDLYEREGRRGFSVEEKDRQDLLMLYTRGGNETGYLKARNGRFMITLDKPGYESRTENADGPERKKLSVDGICLVKRGEPLSLTLCRDGCEVTATAGLVEEAKNRPLLESDVRKQLLKTGATEFEFKELTIRLSPDCFVPVKALNELRRDAFLRLCEALCTPHRRGPCDRMKRADLTMEETTDGREPDAAQEDRSVPALFVMVNTIQEAEKLCGEAVDGFYVENRGTEGLSENALLKICTSIRERGKKIYLALPYVFRENAARDTKLFCYDGVLARSFGELQWLKETGYTGSVRTDFNVYSFNREAIEAVRDVFRVESDTAPLELNSHELSERGISRSELVVYGRIPMMISAQCLRKTFGKCSPQKQKSSFLYLRDRYKKEFPVLADCSNCVNVIYNSVPTSLHTGMEVVRRLAPSGIRLTFIDEDTELQKQMIRTFRALLDGGVIGEFPVRETTAGHWKRGVE